MKLKIGTSGKGKKYKFLDGELEIRPYKASMSILTGNVDGFVRIEGKDQLKAFKYCLRGWSGFTDDADQEIKLTDQVKEDIYDYADELGLKNEAGVLISAFVLRKGGLLSEREEADQEN